MNEETLNVEDKTQKKAKKKIWNIAAEVLNREHGFLKKRNESFHKDLFISRYIYEKMQLSHQLAKLTQGDAPIINFNCKGDLICAGCIYNNGKNSAIAIIDWARTKLKAEILIEKANKISDANFMNAEFYRNEINIVSAYENGLIRYDAVQSNGKTILLQTVQLSVERHRLAKCPGKEHELLSAAASGNIFGIDLRCDPQEMPALLAQTKPVGKFVKLYAVSHHPLAPQICASYSDFNVRVFDKRKFDRPLHSICPSHLVQTNSFANFSDCVYSYDGREILAIYTREKIYLFDSDNKNPGQFKQAISQAGFVGYSNKISFFGTKSEYIIVGNDGFCIDFFDKITGIYKKGILLRKSARFGSVDFLALKSHPHFPVIATSAEGKGGLNILSPSSQKIQFLDD